MVLSEHSMRTGKVCASQKMGQPLRANDVEKRRKNYNINILVGCEVQENWAFLEEEKNWINCSALVNTQKVDRRIKLLRTTQ